MSWCRQVKDTVFNKEVANSNDDMLLKGSYTDAIAVGSPTSRHPSSLWSFRAESNLNTSSLDPD
ncbi:hypothetical protein BCON_0261g00120 [Botryotinia convoluta]|uniref:Uncharacterized protein n=1 Tax=Botryotinia convoluta TaxID=54673 RepID=A0A4Z1HGD0_9HELO|nr:hypothetical protein BCON_0261g00120 [Botryotinia convoluta]